MHNSYTIAILGNVSQTIFLNHAAILPDKRLLKVICEHVTNSTIAQHITVKAAELFGLLTLIFLWSTAINQFREWVLHRLGRNLTDLLLFPHRGKQRHSLVMQVYFGFLERVVVILQRCFDQVEVLLDLWSRVRLYDNTKLVWATERLEISNVAQLRCLDRLALIRCKLRLLVRIDCCPVLLKIVCKHSFVA